MASIDKLKDSDVQILTSIAQLKDMVMILSSKIHPEKSTTSPQSNDLGKSPLDLQKSPSPFSAQSSVQTRYTKIDFPCFLSEDPSGWIYKCERFFEFNRIEEDQKVKLVVMHLDDKAIH